MPFNINLVPRAGAVLRQRLLGRLRTATALAMPELRFARLIQELESDVLFQRLFFGDGDRNLPRVLRRRPWPNGRLCAGFYELREETVADRGTSDIGPLLDKHREVLGAVKKMGRESFERYFLRDEADSMGEIARKTGFSRDEVRRMHELILDISVLSEFYRPPPLPQAPPVPGRTPHAVIAEVEIDPRLPDKPALLWTSLPLARGRYEVDWNAMERWKGSGALSPWEKKHLKTLLGKVELINARQNAIFRILEAAVGKQWKYLHSRKPSRLTPLTMRGLARDLGMAASTVSRAASGRSVLLPWKARAPLAGLFPGRRRVMGFILDEIFLERAHRELSDFCVARLIRRRYGLAVSRRNVNDCRRAHKEAKFDVPVKRHFAVL